MVFLKIPLAGVFLRVVFLPGLDGGPASRRPPPERTQTHDTSLAESSLISHEHPNPPPSGREGFSDAGRGLEGESVGGQCLDSMVKEASDGSQDGLADVFGSCGTQHRQRARLSRFKYWRVVRVDQAPGGPCARAAILRRAMTNSS